MALITLSFRCCISVWRSRWVSSPADHSRYDPRPGPCRRPWAPDCSPHWWPWPCPRLGCSHVPAFFTAWSRRPVGQRILLPKPGRRAPRSTRQYNILTVPWRAVCRARRPTARRLPVRSSFLSLSPFFLAAYVSPRRISATPIWRASPGFLNWALAPRSGRGLRICGGPGTCA